MDVDQCWIGRLSSWRVVARGSDRYSTPDDRPRYDTRHDVEGSLGPGIGRNTAVIVLCIHANNNIIDDEPQSHASK